MKSRLIFAILFSACTLASTVMAVETTPRSIPGSEPFVFRKVADLETKAKITAFLETLDLLTKPPGSQK